MQFSSSINRRHLYTVAKSRRLNKGRWRNGKSKGEVEKLLCAHVYSLTPGTVCLFLKFIEPLQRHVSPWTKHKYYFKLLTSCICRLLTPSMTNARLTQTQYFLIFSSNSPLKVCLLFFTTEEIFSQDVNLKIFLINRHAREHTPFVWGEHLAVELTDGPDAFSELESLEA